MSPAVARPNPSVWDAQSTGDRIALIGKALSHPARIEILRLLSRRQTCIGCDIVEEIGLAQSTTSEHLRILKAAGLIVGEIERPRVCYSLNAAALKPLREFLDSVSGATPAAKC
jgi:ArsR family transcriptional regulator, arsenate/arsenite/antimonite-responsive transcriptional repressor